uniref:class I SAM-dependent methyltransferase n=1 Tax=Altererythrobacter segetis TaxID=1104773 RepID=UPI00140AE99C|nr:class I SAM-dependent methyltransferase [Altererythrobacter segetis]
MSKFNWRVRELIFALVRPLFHLGIRATSHVTGKLRPLDESGSPVVLTRGEREEVPPRRLWVGYLGTSEEYLAEGRADMEAVVSLLAAKGISHPRVALDLGCAAGRMTRHFPRTEESEIWGADISAPHIFWCQRNLPELNFVTVSTAPHLPFADNYFDFVFCASVFTHITDLADAWLLEIRRVLKPQGHLYATVQDKVSAEEMRTTYADVLVPSTIAQLKRLERKHAVSRADCEMFYFDNDPSSRVFYDRDYITRKWSKWMDVVAYEERFYHFQSAMLLRKSASA